MSPKTLGRLQEVDLSEAWLSDRKDIAHYHTIVIAPAKTIRLMAEIDEVIAAHGG